MDWLAASIALLAALAAIWQASEAPRARNAANSASTVAGEHETAALAAARESALAAKRSSDAHELMARSLGRQTELAEEAATIRKPWSFEALGPNTSDQKWKVTNETGSIAYNVLINTPSPEEDSWILAYPSNPDNVDPGASLYFTFLRRLSSPSVATVWVLWTPPDGTAQRKHVQTIS